MAQVIVWLRLNPRTCAGAAGVISPSLSVCLYACLSSLSPSFYISTYQSPYLPFFYLSTSLLVFVHIFTCMSVLFSFNMHVCVPACFAVGDNAPSSWNLRLANPVPPSRTFDQRWLRYTRIDVVKLIIMPRSY